MQIQEAHLNTAEREQTANYFEKQCAPPAMPANADYVAVNYIYLVTDGMKWRTNCATNSGLSESPRKMLPQIVVALNYAFTSKELNP